MMVIKMDFSKVFAFLDSEWILYQDIIDRAIKSPYRLLSQINNHLTAHQGKQIRPILTLLSARIFGNPTSLTPVVAAVVEMVHTATLLHDDVVDQSVTRRGTLAVQNLYSPLASVLLGDFWFARAFQLLMDHNGESLLHEFAGVIRDMSEGELYQMEMANQFNMSIPDYYQIITKKTAMLMAAGMAAGARSVGADDAQCTLIEQAGICLGVAFQIRDDILDYSPECDVGKPTGQDIMEGKMTLPLLCALENASAGERKKVKGWFLKVKTHQGLISNILNFVSDCHGIEFAQKAVEAKEMEAKALLMKCPKSEARGHLWDVVGLLSGRNS